MFFINTDILNEFQQVGAKKTKEDEDTESKYSMSDEENQDNDNNEDAENPDDEVDGYSMNDANDDTPNNYSMGDAEKDGEELTPTDPEPENTEDDLGDGNIPDEGGNDDTQADYSMDGTEDGDNTDDTEGDDYSMDGTDGTENGDNTSMGDDLSGGNTGMEGETEDPDQRIKEIESSINSSLTPQDIKNRDKKLKLTFVDTYKLTTDLIDKMQDLPKNEENNDEIDWLIGQASRLKGIIYDYIINNFDNKTYIQNYAVHSKYLVTLTGIKKILQQLKPKKEK